ncbi:MAG TPA: SWIM zinc finger family protein [Acidimicrobiales bacterium]|nr:SWIM zinc finger family protein [Acidimicrobiales bacterium]
MAFGSTWWGKAWIDALEKRAVHDPNRLPRGRTYARRGHAGELQFGSGEVRGKVIGSRLEPYDVLLTVREFRDDEWDCVLDAIVAKAAHAAALLEGELSPEIVADAQSVEVELLPASGELRTACSCPDDAEPCKHAAAVCYAVATALDADPFLLLELRGMSRTELIDAIRARRSGNGAQGGRASGPAAQGVVARDAWRREPGSLPSIPHRPDGGPGRPAAWPSDPPRDAPFDRPGLELLVTDAARRAWAILAGTGSSALDLDAHADLARRAASADERELPTLAFRSGVLPAALEAQASAWEMGGAGGVDMLDAPAWQAPVLTMAAAKERLVDAGFRDAQLRVRSNRITVGKDLQFRLSPQGLWYRFEKPSGRWLLTTEPSGDIDDLLG